MDVDIESEEREVTAEVQITRVDNGYQVTCAKPTKEKRTIRTMFGQMETRVRRQSLVFSNLADVVVFLGEHYKEPVKPL